MPLITEWLRGFTDWMMGLFMMGPSQPMVIGTGDLPFSSGAATSQPQKVDNTGTSVDPLLEDDPPYIPDVDEFGEEDSDPKRRMENCGCKEGFVPVNELTTERLPKGCQSEIVLTEIRQRIFSTVKLTVSYTSSNRPMKHPNSTALYPGARNRGKKNVRYGTGFINPHLKPLTITNERCPCPECKNLSDPKDMFFVTSVLTAAHVVFDDVEAEQTICELFHDDTENKDNVRVLYGVKDLNEKILNMPFFWGNYWLYKRQDIGNIDKRPSHDMFAMTCVSHDMELLKVLNSGLAEFDDHPFPLSTLPFIISHPHGCSKMISFGTYSDMRIQLRQTNTESTQCTIEVGTWVITQENLTTRYPGFFKRHSHNATMYETSKRLQMYIPCDSSTFATFRMKVGSLDEFFLPIGTKWSDGITDIQVTDFSFPDYKLHHILAHKNIIHYYVYDIHTCIGSSGAKVPVDCVFGHMSLCHFGKLPNSNLNRTGFYIPWFYEGCCGADDDDNDDDDEEDDDDFSPKNNI